MRWLSILGFLVGAACFAGAKGAPGAVLEYTLKVRGPQETAWVETGFRLVTTPALVTGNRVKKPRMGGWRLEPLPRRGVAPSGAQMAQAASLMYFSGPTPGLLMRDSGMTLGGRLCRLWQAQAPAGVAAYAYLAEVAPGLLALSYLSASLREGPFEAIEIHLDRAVLGGRPSPAEDGTALLRTLRRWGAAAAPQGEAALPPERVD